MKRSFQKKKRHLVLAGLAVSGLLFSCSRKQDPDAAALARVGDSEITVGEFRAAMVRRAGDVPQVFEDPANRRALLDEMIRFEALVARARRDGYFDDPEIRGAINRLVVGRLERDAQERAAAGLAVTDEEVRAAYESGAAEFGISARVQAAVIRIERPRVASIEKDAELLAKAERAREEALTLPEATRHFGYLAAKYSDDQATRYKGGDMGWINAGAKDLRWPAGVVDAAFALSSPGECSPVVTADDGYYLVKLLRKEDASRLPFEQVAANIRNRLERERRQRVLDDLYRGSLGAVPVRVDEARLAEVRPAAAVTPPVTPEPPAIPMR